jgi:prepilin signal peptidase PulO-like enzyme (type II secretory pathway)
MRERDVMDPTGLWFHVVQFVVSVFQLGEETVKLVMGTGSWIGWFGRAWLVAVSLYRLVKAITRLLKNGDGTSARGKDDVPPAG